MIGYVTGGFIVGFIVGVTTMIGLTILFNKKFKTKWSDLKFKIELRRIDKRGKK